MMGCIALSMLWMAVISMSDETRIRLDVRELGWMTGQQMNRAGQIGPEASDTMKVSGYTD
jgi:hypothetical protein